MRLLIIALAALVTLSLGSDSHALSRRKQCAQQCKPKASAECQGRKSAVRRCKNAILRTCRRTGVESCFLTPSTVTTTTLSTSTTLGGSGTTTLTTSTTTASSEPPTTTLFVTTTTDAPTTSTTIAVSYSGDWHFSGDLSNDGCGEGVPLDASVSVDDQSPGLFVMIDSGGPALEGGSFMLGTIILKDGHQDGFQATGSFCLTNPLGSTSCSHASILAVPTSSANRMSASITKTFSSPNYDCLTSWSGELSR